jgi:hypothetical protein
VSDEIGESPTTPARAGDSMSTALVLAVLFLALAFTYRAYWGHDPSVSVPAFAGPGGNDRGGSNFATRMDHRFVAWLISHNSRAWVRDPTNLFAGEICHPTAQVVAYGEPAFTLGLIGVPAWIVTGDPLLTYNFVIIALTLISALAMFLLVRAWTGLASAAVIATILYAFHWLRVMDPIHLYASDTAWTVFALYFFRRWLENGRWRDVLGLLASCALQIGGSLYALVSAALVGSALAAWGIARIGLRATRPQQWIVLVLGIAATLYAMFTPYLENSASGDLADRPVQIYLAWSALIPGGSRSLGLLLPILAAAAFIRRERNNAQEPTPIWPLLIGGLITLLVATGGNQAARTLAELSGAPAPLPLPNLFSVLGLLIPGLDVVRLPTAIGTGGLPLTLGILAGFGSASLLRKVPAARVATLTGVLVGLALIDMLRPGLPSPYALQMQPLRPSDADLAFYRALDEKGNEGALLELPITKRQFDRTAKSIMLAAYHERPTSACYNSFFPEEAAHVRRLAAGVPGREAFRELAAMGFTTVVVHHLTHLKRSTQIARQFEELSLGGGATLRAVHRTLEKSAYRIAIE